MPSFCSATAGLGLPVLRPEQAQQPAQEQVQQPSQQPSQQPPQEITFPIEAFLVEGNTLLPPEVIQDTIEGMIGPEKKASDVETARDTLEKLYHSKGYPTVLVGIPEQSVQEGIIRLDVVESKIAKVKTVGNRFVTAEKILRELPSMKPGEVLYTPEVQKEFSKANENADIKVTPSLSPGSRTGHSRCGSECQGSIAPACES